MKLINETMIAITGNYKEIDATNDKIFFLVSFFSHPMHERYLRFVLEESKDLTKILELENIVVRWANIQNEPDYDLEEHFFWLKNSYKFFESIGFICKKIIANEMLELWRDLKQMDSEPLTDFNVDSDRSAVIQIRLPAKLKQEFSQCCEGELTTTSLQIRTFIQAYVIRNNRHIH